MLAQPGRPPNTLLARQVIDAMKRPRVIRARNSGFGRETIDARSSIASRAHDCKNSAARAQPWELEPSHTALLRLRTLPKLVSRRAGGVLVSRSEGNRHESGINAAVRIANAANIA